MALLQVHEHLQGQLASRWQTVNNCQLFHLIKLKLSFQKSQQQLTDLSTDQQYLLDMCEAVINGYCPPALFRRDPGATCMSLSRWITTANRIILRLSFKQMPVQQSENIGDVCC